MKTRGLNILVLLIIFFILIGCQKAAPLILKEFGPTKIKVEQAFNVQPNGESAIWTITENATKTTVIAWGEKQLKTTFGSSKNLTALVTKELYSKPGQFQIYLLDTKTGAKSNSLVFTVEE